MAWRNASRASRLAVIVLLWSIPLAVSPLSTRQPVRPSPPPMTIGMYNTGTPWSFTSFNAYEAQLGVHMQIVHWYQSWGAADVNASARGSRRISPP